MSERLTDEQVVVELRRIRDEEPKHTCDYEGECWTCGTQFPCLERRRMDLAVALQERLQKASQDNCILRKIKTDGDTAREFDRAEIARLRERLQAVEAEMEEAQKRGEELGALDCQSHADHIAAMHDQLKCSCNYDRKGDICAWHADIVDSARQQARREAFEEAAKFMESRKVTASEFYGRELRALAEAAPK
jgi:hypothetical protein